MDATTYGEAYVVIRKQDGLYLKRGGGWTGDLGKAQVTEGGKLVKERYLRDGYARLRAVNITLNP